MSVAKITHIKHEKYEITAVEISQAYVVTLRKTQLMFGFLLLFFCTSTMSEDCSEQRPGDRHHPGISHG